MSIPIKTILNNPPRSPVSNVSASRASSPVSDLMDSPSPVSNLRTRGKKTRDTSDLSFTRPTGVIRYGAYENKNDEASMRLMEPFDIFAFGSIEQLAAHIPYSSDKKDLKAKTGREKLEVFVYRFTDPNDKQDYDVMWDFRGGYVRISPFFKNRKHKKTAPAKMLEVNPGMRKVTTQITGGNRIAQGYWVHIFCARAVCATFCYHIRGALIPIFGPDFPNDCIRPDQKGYNCMAINPKIIRDSEVEVKAYLFTGRPLTTITSYPQPLVEDQYAGSPMEQCAMRKSSEAHYYAQNELCGPSPPDYYVPASSYTEPIESIDPRATPERDYYRALPLASPCAPSLNARPYSSSSEACETYPSLGIAPQRSPAPSSAMHSPTKMQPEPQESFARNEMRKLSPEVQVFKETKTQGESVFSEDVVRSSGHFKEGSYTVAPIDPELEQAAERIIVNEPAPTNDSSASSTPATRTHMDHKDYEGAAILLAMSMGGRNASTIQAKEQD